VKKSVTYELTRADLKNAFENGKPPTFKLLGIYECESFVDYKMVSWEGLPDCTFEPVVELLKDYPEEYQRFQRQQESLKPPTENRKRLRNDNSTKRSKRRKIGIVSPDREISNELFGDNLPQDIVK
jgi:hypothetical protein